MKSLQRLLPLFVLCSSIFAGQAQTAEPMRPNILIIFTDDQGYADLGCFGSEANQTPRMDQFASEGTKYTNFYAQPVCGPSRSALLTGRYPIRSKGWGMPADEITIGEMLKKADYQTACIGKWDVSSRKAIIDRMPNAQGFDYYYGALGANDNGVIKFHQNNHAAGETTDMSILTRRYTDKAIDFLKNRRAPDKPFLLYLSHTMMHTNIDASPEFKGKSKGGLYGDVVEEFDYETGRLLDTIDELKLRDNTLVIYTTDNGPWCQSRYYEAKMGPPKPKSNKSASWYMPKGSVFWGAPGPLRGGKGSAYEAGSRVPCIARWPGQVAAGETSDALWATIDFLPTFAALTGAEVPDDRTIDGVDQAGLLAGKTSTLRDSFIYEQASGGGVVGIRDDRWKLLIPGRKPKNPHRYLMDFGSNDFELYDLANDISEKYNVAQQYPEVVSRLRTKLASFRASVSASVARSEKPTATKPNVILIYADDLGFGDLGCYGATKVKTPNIDRLAREGRRFTDAHSASAVCSPSRYSLLTGEYAFRNTDVDMWGPLGHGSKLSIDTNKLTLGELFSEADYRTACIGKWHLGFGKEKPNFNKPLRPGPLQLGFDYFFGISTNNSANPFVYIENDRVFGWQADDPLVPTKNGKTPYPKAKVGQIQENRFAGARKAHELYDNRQTGTLLSEKTVSWIKQNKEEPFFLYYAPPQIHHPFTPHPRFVGTSDCGMYGDFIHELDWMVGEILNTLHELKLTDNTIVIFTSDNGGMFNMGGKQAFDQGHRQNGDLLGFKFGVWEGGHRVPFLVRWPDRVKSGSESSQLFCSMDLLATFATVLKRELMPSDAVDSFDQLETITGQPTSAIRDHLLLSPRDEKAMGLRQDKWVFIDAQGDGSMKFSEQERGGAWAVAYTKTPQSDISSDGKVKRDAPSQQLYDLETDPFQSGNVTKNHAERAARMRQALTTIRESASTRQD